MTTKVQSKIIDQSEIKDQLKIQSITDYMKMSEFDQKQWLSTTQCCPPSKAWDSLCSNKTSKPDIKFQYSVKPNFLPALYCNIPFPVYTTEYFRIRVNG